MLIGAANDPDFPNDDPRTREESWADLEAQVGELQVRRSYEGALPATFANARAGFDEGTGRISWISFKYPPDEVVAGTHDTAITDFVNSIPSGHKAWLTYFHEPEDNMTAAEFVPASQHVYTLVSGLLNPDIELGPVYSEWTWDPRSGRDIADWDPGPGFRDFIGVDTYNRYTPASLPPNDPNEVNENWDDPTAPGGVEAIDWFIANTVQGRVSEFGCHEDDTGIGPTRKADWLDTFYHYCEGKGIDAICYFDSYVGGRGPWWLVTSSLSQDTFSALVIESQETENPPPPPLPSDKLELYRPVGTEVIDCIKHISNQLDKIDVSFDAVPSSSLDRPSNPFPGMIIIEQDTKTLRFWEHNTSQWVYIAKTGESRGRGRLGFDFNTSSSSSVNNTESLTTPHLKITLTAEANRKYMVYWDVIVDTTSGHNDFDGVVIDIRAAKGDTVTKDDSSFDAERAHFTDEDTGFAVNHMNITEWIPSSAGQWTIGLFLRKVNGAEEAQIGGNHHNVLAIEDAGPISS